MNKAITPPTTASAMQSPMARQMNTSMYGRFAIISPTINPRHMNIRRIERIVWMNSCTGGSHGWAVNVMLQVGDHDVVKFPHISSCISLLEFVKQIVQDGKGSEGNIPKWCIFELKEVLIEAWRAMLSGMTKRARRIMLGNKFFLSLPL